MGISEVFGYFPHDILIVKLATYGFPLKTLAYIYTWLKNRKQCAWIKDMHSNCQIAVSLES